jgi:hypothetical protein
MPRDMRVDRQTDVSVFLAHMQRIDLSIVLDNTKLSTIGGLAPHLQWRTATADVGNNTASEASFVLPT